jgi:hypothetical protein
MTDTDHNTDSQKTKMSELITEFYRLDRAIRNAADESDVGRLTRSRSDVFADLVQCRVAFTTQALSMLNCLLVDQNHLLEPVAKTALGRLKEFLEASKGDRGREVYQAFEDIGETMRALEARSGLLCRLAELEANGLEGVLYVTGEDMEHDLQALSDAHNRLRSVLDGQVKFKAARVPEAASL